MRLTDIAVSNLRRRKGKMSLLVLGLAIGTATAVTLLAITETMQFDVANKLDQYGANILIVPRANDLTLSYGGLSVSSATYDVGQLMMQDAERIRSIKNAQNVSVIAPKLLSVVEINGQPVLAAGIIFAEELRLKSWWQIEGMEPQTDNDALVGARVAEKLALTPGAVVTIGNRQFTIVGVLAENGSQDDGILFIALNAAQKVWGKPDILSLIEVSALCSGCPIEEIVAQISEAIPQARVSALRQAVTLRMEVVHQLGRFAQALSVVVMTIGALVVLTTMLGAVAERKQEIGIFRAVGFRQSHIMRVILTEAATVSLVGGFLGWLVGMVATTALAPTLAQVTVGVRWDPLLAVGAIGAALSVGLLASLYPAWLAAQLDPTTALRSL